MAVTNHRNKSGINMRSGLPEAIVISGRVRRVHVRHVKFHDIFFTLERIIINTRYIGRVFARARGRRVDGINYTGAR